MNEPQFGEPWEVCGHVGQNVRMKGSLIDWICSMQCSNVANFAENAKRIVACVNFLAGVPTEFLTSHKCRLLMDVQLPADGPITRSTIDNDRYNT